MLCRETSRPPSGLLRLLNHGIVLSVQVAGMEHDRGKDKNASSFRRINLCDLYFNTYSVQLSTVTKLMKSPLNEACQHLVCTVTHLAEQPAAA